MSSSIFNFDFVRDYARLPRAERRWHAVIGIVLVSVVAICHPIPALVFGSAGCKGGTLGSTAIASLSEKTEIVFLGSSHVLFGIRPQQYSVKAMNLASTWLDYTCAQRLIEKHLPRVPNLKIAVIEYDELPLVSDLVPALIATGDPRPLTELSLSPLEIPTASVGQKLALFYKDWLFPITSLPRLTPLGLRTTPEICTPLHHPPKGFSPGYYYTEGVTPPTFDANLLYVALQSAAKNDAVIERNLQALKSTIDLLRSRGVTVVLLRLPHAPDYNSNRPAIVTARWRQLETWARAESSADDGILIWDHGADPAFQAGDFVDNHHLNVFGANKLAHALDGDLRLLVREAHRRPRAGVRVSDGSIH